MGRTNNSRLGVGTGTSRQGNIKQGTVDAKINELEKELLLKELIDKGVKFNPEDVIFITKDKSGMLIWLETGNEIAGFVHIKKHIKQFIDKHGIKENELEEHLKFIITNGVLEYFKIVKRKNKDGYERLYSKDGKYYIVAGVGLNGFIVSAYPLNEKEAKDLIRRNKQLWNKLLKFN